jgi:hypothetical protein
MEFVFDRIVVKEKKNNKIKSSVSFFRSCACFERVRKWFLDFWNRLIQPNDAFETIFRQDVCPSWHHQWSLKGLNHHGEQYVVWTSCNALGGYLPLSPLSKWHYTFRELVLLVLDKVPEERNFGKGRAVKTHTNTKRSRYRVKGLNRVLRDFLLCHCLQRVCQSPPSTTVWGTSNLDVQHSNEQWKPRIDPTVN